MFLNWEINKIRYFMWKIKGTRLVKTFEGREAAHGSKAHALYVWNSGLILLLHGSPEHAPPGMPPEPLGPRSFALVLPEHHQDGSGDPQHSRVRGTLRSSVLALDNST